MKSKTSSFKSNTGKERSKRVVESRRFQPGENVERSGVYEAFHSLHRVTHKVTLIAGHPFPLCSRCRDRVRFKLVKANPSLNETNSPLVHVIGVFLPEAA